MKGFSIFECRFSILTQIMQVKGYFQMLRRIKSSIENWEGGMDKLVCPWERVMNKIIGICGLIFLFAVIFNSNAYPFWGSKYLAKVNGEVITAKDFKDSLMRFHMSPKAVRDSSIKFDYRRFLNRIIDDRLMIQEAYRFELDKKPDFIKRVKAKEQSVLKRHGNKKNTKVRNWLEKYKELQLIHEFKKNIIYPMIRLTDDELREYYDNNKERFMRSDRVMLDIIEVKGEKEAKELRNELINGANFSMLAREKSVATSAKKGGNIGWVSMNRLSPVIAEAVKKIEVNEITNIILIGHSSYMIIKLNGLERGTLKKFSVVRDEIYGILGKQRYDSLLKRYLAELRKVSSIKINEKSLRRLK